MDSLDKEQCANCKALMMYYYLVHLNKEGLKICGHCKDRERSSLFRDKENRRSPHNKSDGVEHWREIDRSCSYQDYRYTEVKNRKISKEQYGYYRT